MDELKIDAFIQVASKDIFSYVVLLNYHYQNLPIKAEPVSLLPIQVEIEGKQYHLDDISVVSKPEWNQLMIHPNYEEYIPYICKSIPFFHPEFKIETTRYVIEQLGKEQRVVLLTMPEVDDERYKTLNDGCKSLASQCKGVVKEKYTKQETLIPIKLNGLSPEKLNVAKDRLSETHDNAIEKIDELLKDKLEEIEKAHKEYLEKHGSVQNDDEDSDSNSCIGTFSFSDN